MKAKKSGSTKGKSSAKRAVKDLTAKSAASVKGGGFKGGAVIPTNQHIRKSALTL